MVTRQGSRKLKCNPAISHFCIGKTGRGSCIPNSKKCETALTGINQTIAVALGSVLPPPLYATDEDRLKAVEAIVPVEARRIYDRDRNDEQILNYYLVPGSEGRTFNQIAKEEGIDSAEVVLRQNSERKAKQLADQQIKQQEIAHETTQINSGSDNLLKGRLQAFRSLYPQHNHNLTLREFQKQSPEQYDRLLKDLATENRTKRTYSLNGLISRGDRYLSQFQLDSVEGHAQLKAQLLGNLSPEESAKLVDQKAFNGVDTNTVRDAAIEFYQLTGGLGASSLKQFKQTSFRAYADRSGTLNVGLQSKRTIFHEMGHFIEFENPRIAQAASQLVQRRATGPIAKLNDLMRAGFDDNETAYPDDFCSPYVGKVYGYNATEVTSVGLQKFKDPSKMLALYKKDPEHFKFIIGVIEAGKEGRKNV